jgi:hypothetical protein
MATGIRNSFEPTNFQQLPQTYAFEVKKGVNFNHNLSTIQANDPAPAALAAADSASGCCGITGFISRIYNAITGCLSGTWNKFLGFFGKAPAAPAAPTPAPAPAVKDPLVDFLALYADKKANLGKAFKNLPSAEQKVVYKRMYQNAKDASDKPKTVAKDTKVWKKKVEQNPNSKALKDAVVAILDDRKKAAAAAAAAPAAPAAPAV